MAVDMATHGESNREVCDALLAAASSLDYLEAADEINCDTLTQLNNENNQLRRRIAELSVWEAIKPHAYEPFTTRDGSQACGVCHAPPSHPIHSEEARLDLDELAQLRAQSAADAARIREMEAENEQLATELVDTKRAVVAQEFIDGMAADEDAARYRRLLAVLVEEYSHRFHQTRTKFLLRDMAAKAGIDLDYAMETQRND